MKQTWKWAMMLFVALTMAIGTTSCSSDDDDDEGGNIPEELQGKWVLVWEAELNAAGEVVNQISYTPATSDCFILITSNSLQGYDRDGEIDSPKVNITYNDGVISVVGGNEYNKSRVESVTASEIVWSFKPYDPDEGVVLGRERYCRLENFPWE